MSLVVCIGLCIASEGFNMAAHLEPIFKKYNFTPELRQFITAINKQESGGKAVSVPSNHGALGGMQILPATAKEIMPGIDLKNPEQLLEAGALYAKQMYERAKGDVRAAAAGYYSGPKGMDDFLRGVYRRDLKNPNAPNTLQYANKVVERMRPIPVSVQEPLRVQEAAAKAPPTVMDQIQENVVVPVTNAVNTGLDKLGTFVDRVAPPMPVQVQEQVAPQQSKPYWTMGDWGKEFFRFYK